MNTPTIEVVVDRDPDAGTDVTVFVNGEPVQVLSYTVDPGYGATRSDWLENREMLAATATPKAAELITSLFDRYADNYEFIAEG
jgi:hypothetical protein